MQNSYPTVYSVLNNLDRLIEKGESVYTMIVCRDLSIFDWWKNTLSIDDLKTMRAFLHEAVKMGFDGYTCFKVGAHGCANGMWAHTATSTDGMSPADSEGDILYRSFTPDYTRWSAMVNGKWCEPDGTLRDTCAFIVAQRRERVTE